MARAEQPPARSGPRIGLVAATALVVGNVVGMGVFLTARTVAAASTSAAVYVGWWVLGGAVALAGAASIGELASRLPQAGGDYVYLRRAWGPSVAFAWGWLSFAGAFCGSLAALARGFGDAVTEAAGWSLAGYAPVALGAGLLVGLLLVHFAGLRASAAVQSVLAWLPATALAALAVWGLAAGPAGGVAPGAPAAPTPAPAQPAGPAVVFAAVFFAYSGWNAAIYVAPEVRDAARTVPRALLLGTGLTVAVYVLFAAACAWVVGLDGLRGASNAATALLDRLGGPRAARATSWVAAAAIAGTVHGTAWAGSRIWAAMAERGDFPRVAGRHLRNGVPAVSLALQTAVALALLGAGSLDFLFAWTGGAMMLLSCLTVAGLFVLRRRTPAVRPPFVCPAYPWPPLAYLAANLAALVLGAHGDPAAFASGLAIVLLAGAAHAYFLRRRRRP